MSEKVVGSLNRARDSVNKMVRSSQGLSIHMSSVGSQGAMPAVVPHNRNTGNARQR